MKCVETYRMLDKICDFIIIGMIVSAAALSKLSGDKKKAAGERQLS